jgi:hypothetical protein
MSVYTRSLLFAALLIGSVAHAAAPFDTVTGMVQRVIGTWNTNTAIIFSCTNCPRNINGIFINSEDVVARPNSNGAFSIQLAGPLGYRVRVGTAFSRDVASIQTIGDGSTNDWLNLTTNSALSTPAANPFMLRNNGSGTNTSLTRPRIFSTAGGTNPPGSSNWVWSLTNILTGEGEWRAPGSGSGDVTTAQLNTASNVLALISGVGSNANYTLTITASNALLTITRADNVTTSNGVLAVVVANDTITSNALRTAFLDSDITTSNGLVNFSLSMSNALYGFITGGGITASVATNIAEYVSLITSNGLMAQLNWRTRPIYFFDAVAGSDANTGTNSASPWKTNVQFKLTNIYGPTLSGLRLRFAGGAEWREQLTLNSFNDVQRYGSGPDPIFNAADVVTNWSKVGGLTSVYAVTNFTITGGGSDTLIQVIEDGVQLVYTNSPADVDAHVGTFFVINDSSVGSATNIVFVNPRRGGNPFTNGGTYELSKRNFGIIMDHNNYVFGVETRNALGRGIVALFDNHLNRVAAYNCGKHNFYISSGLVEDSRFMWAQYPSSLTLSVNHSETDGLKIVFRNCLFGGTPDQRVRGDAIIGHTSSEIAYKSVIYDRCVFQYVAGIGSPGNGTNGSSIFSDVEGYGLTSGGVVFYGGTNTITGSRIYRDPVFGANNFVGVNVSGSRSFNYISGNKIIGEFPIYSGSAAISNALVKIDENALVGPASGGNTAIYFAGTNGTLSISNNVAHNFAAIYSIATNNTISGANSNVFPSGVGLTYNGVSFATWGAYRAAHPSLDAGSVTNDAQWLGNPALKNFAFSDESPINTNQAGPFWNDARKPTYASTFTTLPDYQAGGPWLLNQFRLSTGALWAAKLDVTDATAIRLDVSGNFTNTQSEFSTFESVGNHTMTLRRSGIGNFLRLSLQEGTTEDAALYLEPGARRLNILGAGGTGVGVIGQNSAVGLFGGGGYIASISAHDTGQTNVYVGPNNVGLGTNDPQAKLHVHGTVRFENNGSNATVVSVYGKNTSGNLVETAVPSASVPVDQALNTLSVTQTVKRGWVFQGGNTNQSLNWAATNYFIIQPTGTVTIAFANVPAAGSLAQSIALDVYWTNASGSIVWPSGIDWRGTAPAPVAGITNQFTFTSNGTNLFGYASQEITTGTGYGVNSNTPSIFNPTILGSTILTNTLAAGLGHRFETNAGVISVIRTNPVVNFSGGSTGSGNVATQSVNFATVADGMMRSTNVCISNQWFEVSAAAPGQSVTIDGVGTNVTWTIVFAGINTGAEVLWALNSTTNGATHLTVTNSVCVVRCIETNKFSAVFAQRRR